MDLLDAGGTKLRLVALPNGMASVHLFPPGASTSIELGACGPLAVERQNSSINDIYNVKGNATLSCAGVGRSVQGNITFENCH